MLRLVSVTSVAGEQWSAEPAQVREKSENETLELFILGHMLADLEPQDIKNMVQNDHTVICVLPYFLFKAQY